MWRNKFKGLLALVLALTVGIGLAGCGKKAPAESRPTGSSLFSRVTEVSPPATIQELRPYLDTAQPQVKILSPRTNEVLSEDQVTVRFQVKDLVLFKNDEFGLGPHLHVFLDDEPYRPVYDPSEPLVLSGLTPGSHTLRVFASRPWHESFKNEGAYAQTTFHVYTQTAQRIPQAGAPLLTYSRPQGSYGAEPVMLDFYLTDAPLHLVAQEQPDDNISDWQIRCTVNGNSFTVNAWEPLYLKGFKSGKNWVKLELLDEKGNLFPGVFNSAVRLIDYTPGGQDTLSKLVRGEIPVEVARQIVDPNYVPPAPIEPEPVELEPAESEPVEPSPIAPEPEPTPVEIIAPEAPSSDGSKPQDIEPFRPEPNEPEPAEPVRIVPAEDAEPELPAESPTSVERSPEPEILNAPAVLDEPTQEPASLDDERSLDLPVAAPTPAAPKPSNFMERFRKARQSRSERRAIEPSPAASPAPVPALPDEIAPLAEPSEPADAQEPQLQIDEQPERFSIDDLITPSEEPLPDPMVPEPIPVPTETPQPSTFAPPTATRSRPKSPDLKDFLKRFQRQQPSSGDSSLEQPSQQLEPEAPGLTESPGAEIPQELEAPAF